MPRGRTELFDLRDVARNLGFLAACQTQSGNDERRSLSNHLPPRQFTGYLLTTAFAIRPVGLSPIQRFGVFVAGGMLVSLLVVTLATALVTQPTDPVSE